MPTKPRTDKLFQSNTEKKDYCWEKKFLKHAQSQSKSKKENNTGFYVIR